MGWQEDYYGKVYASPKSYAQGQKTKKKNQQRKNNAYDNATRQSAQQFAKDNGIKYDENFYNSYNKAVTNKYREQDYLKLNEKHQSNVTKQLNQKQYNFSGEEYQSYKKDYDKMRSVLGYSKSTSNAALTKPEYDRLSADYENRIDTKTANFLKDIKTKANPKPKKKTDATNWFDEHITKPGKHLLEETGFINKKKNKNELNQDILKTLAEQRVTSSGLMNIPTKENQKTPTTNQELIDLLTDKNQKGQTVDKKKVKQEVHYSNQVGKNVANTIAMDIPSVTQHAITGKNPSYVKNKKAREEGEHIGNASNAVLMLSGIGALAEQGAKYGLKGLAKNILSKKGLLSTGIGGTLGGLTGAINNQHQKNIGNQLSTKEKLINIGENTAMGALFGKLLGSHIPNKTNLANAPKGTKHVYDYVEPQGKVGHKGTKLINDRSPLPPSQQLGLDQLRLPSPGPIDGQLALPGPRVRKKAQVDFTMKGKFLRPKTGPYAKKEQLLLNAPDYRLGTSYKRPLELPAPIQKVVQSMPKKQQVNFDAQLKDLEQLHEIEKTVFAENNPELIANRKAEIQAEINRQIQQETEYQGHQNLANEYDNLVRAIKQKSNIKDPFTGKKIRTEPENARIHLTDEERREYGHLIPKELIAKKDSGKGQPLDVLAQEHGFGEDIPGFVNFLNKGKYSKNIVKNGRGNFVTQTLSGNVDNVVDDLFNQSESGQRIKSAWNEVLARMNGQEPQQAPQEPPKQNLGVIDAAREESKALMEKEIADRLQQGEDPQVIREELKNKEVARILKEEIAKTDDPVVKAKLQQAVNEKEKSTEKTNFQRAADLKGVMPEGKYEQFVQEFRSAKGDGRIKALLNKYEKEYFNKLSPLKEDNPERQTQGKKLKSFTKAEPTEQPNPQKQEGKTPYDLRIENANKYKQDFKQLDNGLYEDTKTGLVYNKDEANQSIKDFDGHRDSQNGYHVGDVVRYHTYNTKGEKFPSHNGIITKFETRPNGVTYAHITYPHKDYATNGSWIELANIEGKPGKAVINNEVADILKNVPKDKEWLRENVREVITRRYQNYIDGTPPEPTPPKKPIEKTVEQVKKTNKKPGRQKKAPKTESGRLAENEVVKPGEDVIAHFRDSDGHSTTAKAKVVHQVSGGGKITIKFEDGSEAVTMQEFLSRPEPSKKPIKKTVETLDSIGAQKKLNEMKSKLTAPKKPLTDKTKLKRLKEMRDFAEKHGLEFSDRFKNLIPKLEKQIEDAKPKTEFLKPEPKVNGPKVLESTLDDVRKFKDLREQRELLQQNTHENLRKLSKELGMYTEKGSKHDLMVENIIANLNNVPRKRVSGGEDVAGVLSIGSRTDKLKENLSKEDYSAFNKEFQAAKNAKDGLAVIKKWENIKKDDYGMTVDESTAKVPTNEDKLTTLNKLAENEDLTAEEKAYIQNELFGDDETSATVEGGGGKKSPFSGSKKRPFRLTVNEDQLAHEQKADSYTGNIKQPNNDGPTVKKERSDFTKVLAKGQLKAEKGNISDPSTSGKTRTKDAYNPTPKNQLSHEKGNIKTGDERLAQPNPIKPHELDQMTYNVLTGEISSPSMESTLTRAKDAFSPHEDGQYAMNFDGGDIHVAQSHKEEQELISEFNKMKDLHWQQGNGLTLPEIINKLPKKLKEYLTQVLDKGKADNVNMQIKEVANFFKTIVAKGKKGGLGIRKGSKESKWVSQYGEQHFVNEWLKKNNKVRSDYSTAELAEMNRRELRKVAGNKRVKDIIDAHNFLFNKYNEYIDQYNVVRQGLGLDPIPKRDSMGMYKHFQDLENLDQVKNTVFGSAGNDVKTNFHDGNLDNWKESEGFKKDLKDRVIKGKFVYKHDAVAGFLSFLKSASHSIHLQPIIHELRNTTNFMENTIGSNKLPRLRKALEKNANDLAGHTNKGDLSFHDFFDSRRVTSIIHWANSRVQANMIKGNIGSLVGQLGGIPLNVARTGVVNSLRGGIRTAMEVMQFLGGKRKGFPYQQSKFMRERYIHQHYEVFNDRIRHIPGKVADWLLNTIDKVVGHFTWNGMYEKGKRLARKDSSLDPIQYADYHTREVLAGRGVGEVPLIHKSLIGKVFAPFTLEVGNQWKVLARMGMDKKEIGNLITYSVVAYGINKLSDWLRGSEITFDPIAAVTDGYNHTEGGKLRKVMGSIGSLAGETIGSIPLGNALISIINDRKVPFTGGEYTYKDAFGNRNPNRFGTSVAFTKGMESPWYYALPFGGSQIDKMIKGNKLIKNQGVYNKSGNLRYAYDPGTGPKGIVKKSQVWAFGPGSAPESKQYYKDLPKTLSPAQTKRVDDKKTGEDRVKQYQKELKERAERAAKKKGKNKLHF